MPVVLAGLSLMIIEMELTLTELLDELNRLKCVDAENTDLRAEVLRLRERLQAD